MKQTVREYVESKTIDEIAHHWKCNKEARKLTQNQFDLLKVTHDVYFEKTGNRFPDYNYLSKITIIDAK